VWLVSLFVRVQSRLTLDRSSADFMAELRNLIVADARVAEADIVSIHCGVVELTDRYDVDELVRGDALVVRLRTIPQAPGLSQPSAAAVPAAGQKRSADAPDPAADNQASSESAAKRPKRSNKKK
jgi:hypothetical protein